MQTLTWNANLSDQDFGKHITVDIVSLRAQVFYLGDASQYGQLNIESTIHMPNIESTVYF